MKQIVGFSLCGLRRSRQFGGVQGIVGILLERALHRRNFSILRSPPGLLPRMRIPKT
jgi:hypothetical protein